MVWECRACRSEGHRAGDRPVREQYLQVLRRLQADVRTIPCPRINSHVPDVNRENILRQAKLGQIATHSAIAEARRAATRKRQAEAQSKWDSSTLPKWLDEDVYRQKILPLLSTFTVKTIRLAIDVSHPYATLIRRGDRMPHPRHWSVLAKLVGVSDSLEKGQ